MTWAVLRSPGQISYRMSLSLSLSNAFLMTGLELRVLGKNTTEVKCHCHLLYTFAILNYHILYVCYFCIPKDISPIQKLLRFKFNKFLNKKKKQLAFAANDSKGLNLSYKIRIYEST